MSRAQKCLEKISKVRTFSTPGAVEVKEGDWISVVGFFTGGLTGEETREGQVTRIISKNECFVKVDGKEYKVSWALYHEDSGRWRVAASTGKSRSLTRQASKAFRGKW